MKKKNKHLFWYFGFLTFLSLLVFPTNNYAFLGFLGFSPYFFLFKKNDERLEILIGKSTKNAFMFLVFSAIIFLIYGSFSNNKYMEFIYPVLFSGSVITCIISYFYLEYFNK